MTVRAGQDLIDRLEAAAYAALPNEACALLLGTGGPDARISDIVLSANVTEGDPRTGFEVDPGLHARLQRAARDGGPDVIGVWHSHPNGVAAPSDMDKRRSLMPGWVWLITGITSDGEALTRAFRAAAREPGTLEPVQLFSA